MSPEQYLARLEAGEEITEIEICDQNRTDAELAPLLRFLNNPLNSAAAQRLTHLNLRGNNLSSFAIPTTLVALQELDLTDNKLSSIAISATLVALQRLLLAGNKLSSLDLPTTMAALVWLSIGGNQLSTIAKIMLIQFLSNNPALGIEADFNIVQNVGPDRITNDTLNEHFQALLKNMKNYIDRQQPLRNMLARKLPNELTSMAFKFLDKNSDHMVNEIRAIKDLFPGRGEIIAAFEGSSDFANIEQAYKQHGRQAHEIAVVHANGMKILLNSYRQRNKDDVSLNQAIATTPILKMAAEQIAAEQETVAAKALASRAKKLNALAPIFERLIAKQPDVGHKAYLTVALAEVKAEYLKGDAEIVSLVETCIKALSALKGDQRTLANFDSIVSKFVDSIVVAPSPEDLLAAGTAAVGEELAPVDERAKLALAKAKMKM